MNLCFDIRSILRGRLLSFLFAGAGMLAFAMPAGGEASHAGWPPIGHFAGHRPGESGVLRGRDRVHNELLGGPGNDTIYAGNMGDVIWGDANAQDNPDNQIDELHGGPGNDWIYASHGYNHIWTGAGDDHIALVYGHGIVDCNGPGVKTLVMRYLPQNRPWKLVGCAHVVVVPYRA
jgi:RTX calcium-binding nonapeptide repeat (4 copies)